MHARGVAAKWQSRRKISLGPVRRACPASGATWNVQVVRGKMTSRCLWHACRALVLGLVLMAIGAGMATIGYYAEHISPHTETRSNSTIRVKTDSKGIHLHNLSYAGPIVMGCGGFIIVAACVMTFEARDSAAKVVPARFKLSTNTRGNGSRMNSSRRTTASSSTQAVGSQTGGRWDNQLGVFRTSPSDNAQQSRVAQTAALVHFSKILGSTSLRHSPKDRRVSRSGSVPNLASCYRPTLTQQNSTSPTQRTIHHHHHTHHRTSKLGANKDRSRGAGGRVSATMQQRTSVHALHLNRFGTSIDESGAAYFQSAAKMSLDLQRSQLSIGKENFQAIIASGEYCANKRDRTKRSDTSKRHILARQKQVDNSAESQNTLKATFVKKRSNSTNSDISNVFRKGGGGCAVKKTSNISRTPSVDSRAVQTDETLLADKITASSPNRKSNTLIAQASTPSVDGKFKSQLSICSEPATIIRRSLDQSLPEEVQKMPSPPLSPSVANATKNGNKKQIKVVASLLPTTVNVEQLPIQAKRPTSLVLKSNRMGVDAAKTDDVGHQTEQRKQKYLYRSNSSSLHKRPSTFVPTATTLAFTKFKLSGELDQIFVISSNKTDTNDDNYDSIEVIDERRMKNLPKSDRARLYKSNTFICEEYYTKEQLADVVDTKDLDEKEVG